MSKKRRKKPLRRIGEPFVVPAPPGVSTSARLEVTEAEHDVLVAVGLLLGQRRCEDWVSLVERRRSGEDFGRQRRREALTAGSTSRWADAVTMSNDRQFRLAMDNLYRERRDKRAALAKVEARLAAPIGGRDGRVRGYRSKAEHAAKVQRRDHLQAKLAEVQRRTGERSPSVQFGGRLRKRPVSHQSIERGARQREAPLHLAACHEAAHGDSSRSNATSVSRA